MSYLLNINLQTRKAIFFKNQPSSLGYLFERYTPFFELVIFLSFRLNAYTRMCVSTLGSFSFWDKNQGIMMKH